MEASRAVTKWQEKNATVIDVNRTRDVRKNRWHFERALDPVFQLHTCGVHLIGLPVRNTGAYNYCRSATLTWISPRGGVSERFAVVRRLRSLLFALRLLQAPHRL
jgi:hypothetical protein